MVDAPTTIEIARVDGNYGVKIASWPALAGASVGKAIEFPDYSDKSIQVGCGASASAGNTFGSGTVILQGTNDPRGDPNHADNANAQWTTLHDPLGVALSFTSFGLKQILENPRWIRPSVSGGTGANIDVVILGKRTR